MLLICIIQKCDNIPGDVQQLCEALWAMTKEREAIASEQILKYFIQL